MIDMKKKAEEILEDYANSYSQADLESLSKFLGQIKFEAVKEFAKEFVADLSHMLTYDKDYIKAKIFHLVEIKTKEVVGDE